MKWQFLLLIPVAVLLAGCVTPAFNRQWKAATAAGVPAAGIGGPWQGTWQSKVNGHKGELRCLVTKPADPAEPWEFHYWFTWSGLKASYTTRFPVVEKDGGFVIKGESDLGKLGGVFHHEGKATRDKFSADYRSKTDRGTFEMSRPPQP